MNRSTPESDTPLSGELQACIDAYLDADPTPEQLAALDAWIRADPANARWFIGKVQMHQQVGRRLKKASVRERLEAERTGDNRSSDSSVFDAEVFKALLEIEAASGEVVPRDVSELIAEAKAEHAEQQPAEAKVTAREVVSTIGYLGFKALRSRAAMAGSIAAMLALTVVLFVVFSGPGTTDTPAPVAQTPEVAAPATLTGQTNASWRTAAGPLSLRPGDTLRPGQRLTLTTGTAQLTTKRGAKAYLQAPCTIEMIDHDNALVLHQGRLVGLVETHKASRFLVRTPHVDVIDLGTRFGVEVWDTATTEVHVFQGKVEVERQATGAAPADKHTLLAGQAVRAEANRPDLIAIPELPARFASIDPRSIALPGTGYRLSRGEFDPNWRIISVNGVALAKPRPMAVGSQPSSGSHRKVPINPGTSQWLRSDRQFENHTRPETTFTCRATFVLPAGIDPATTRLHIAFNADERFEQVRINGKAVTPPANSLTDDHVELNTMQIDGLLVAGTNTVEIDVVDLVRNSGWTWGFRLQWHLETGINPSP